MARKKLFYSGDISIEYGGYFYSLETWKWGYVDVIRVVPVSDAGGPDNIFWIEELTINIRTGEKLAPILASCGVDELPQDATRRHILVDAHMGYGEYDILGTDTVQIGPDDKFYGGNEQFNVSHHLRASVNLRKLARRMAHGFPITASVKPL